MLEGQWRKSSNKEEQLRPHIRIAKVAVNEVRKIHIRSAKSFKGRGHGGPGGGGVQVVLGAAS